MDRHTIECCLKESREFLKVRYGVMKIGYFGSYARNEQDQTSDIDILIELDKKIGFEFLDIKYYLEEKLGITVDLITINGLKPQLKNKVLEEVIGFD